MNQEYIGSPLCTRDQLPERFSVFREAIRCVGKRHMWHAVTYRRIREYMVEATSEGATLARVKKCLSREN